MKVREICEVIGSGIQPLQNLSVLQKIGDGKMDWGHFYINKGFTGEWTFWHTRVAADVSDLL